MFGLGFSEIVLVAVVALIAIGPKKLPEAARNAGRILAQLRNALEDLKRELVLPPLDLSTEDSYVPEKVDTPPCPEEPLRKPEPPAEKKLDTKDEAQATTNVEPSGTSQ